MSHPYLLDRRDVEFCLFEHLGLEELLESERYQEMSREIFDMVLGEALKFSQEILAPLNAVGDKQGCQLENGDVKLPDGFKEAFDKYRRAGWIAPHRPMDFGGQGLPKSLYLAATEFFIGSCTSFLFYPGLTVAAGEVIEHFGDDALVERFVPKMYAGDWTGTMCLTEPHAGSAVGDLKTSATPNDDGTWNIKGTKIFISGGDQDISENIVHLVLARAEGDPDGIKGISLFIVPKLWVDENGQVAGPNDVSVGGIEHKMGINACSTCVMNFGENDGCRGILLGEQRRGIVAMFHMMNEARIVCGAQGMALGNAAYQHALAYAKERVQGTAIKNFKNVDAERVTIVEHPDVKRMLATMKAYGEGLRAMILKAAYLVDKMETEDDEKKKEALHDRVSLLTPIAKAFGSDIGFRMTELAMQTFGGYGYVSEYPIEQYMRDTKIASIYEGTNGIQAMDLLGRKMAMKGGTVFMSWLNDINHFCEAQRENAALGEAVQSFEKVKNALAELAFHFSGYGKDNPEYPMLNAVPFLHAMGHVETAHLLLEQAVIAAERLEEVDSDSRDGQFYRNKVKTALFFVHHLLPQVYSHAHAIKSNDESALEIQF